MAISFLDSFFLPCSSLSLSQNLPWQVIEPDKLFATLILGVWNASKTESSRWGPPQLLFPLAFEILYMKPCKFFFPRAWKIEPAAPKPTQPAQPPNEKWRTSDHQIGKLTRHLFLLNYSTFVSSLQENLRLHRNQLPVLHRLCIGQKQEYLRRSHQHGLMLSKLFLETQRPHEYVSLHWSDM